MVINQNSILELKILISFNRWMLDYIAPESDKKFYVNRIRIFEARLQILNLFV